MKKKLMLLRHFRGVVVSASIVLGLFLSGCSQRAPELDTSGIQSAVSHPGVCEHCKFELDPVREENLIVVRGNQHTVCDEKCEAGLREFLANQ